MNRRSFLRALAAGSVAAVIGEAPRVLTGPRVFHTGGLVTGGGIARLNHGVSSFAGEMAKLAKVGAPAAEAAAKALRVSMITLNLAPRFLESMKRGEPAAVRMGMLAVADAQIAVIESEEPPRFHEGGE